MRIKNVRPTPEGPESESLCRLCDAIAELLPAGAQFGIIVLFPTGSTGQGQFMAQGDGPELRKAMRTILDAAEEQFAAPPRD
jgi:hypothetical protein